MIDCRIETAEKVNAKEWDRFMKEQNPTQIYNYGKVCSYKTTPLYISIYEDGKKVFQWLIFLKKQYFLKILYAISEPYPGNSTYMGGAFKNAVKKFTPFRFEFYSVTLSKFTDINFLQQEHFSKIFEYGTNVIDLKLSEDDIFKGIHTKHRNVIRRASKAGVNVKEYPLTEQNISRYYKISEITYRRSNGKNISLADLNLYRDKMGENKNLRLFVAEYKGVWQAASLILSTRNMSIYWHGATIDKPVTGAANLLHWDTMKILKNEGIDKYDFGGIGLNYEIGSKLERITRFKIRFGGQIKHFYGGIKIYNRLINNMYQIYNAHLKG